MKIMNRWTPEEVHDLNHRFETTNPTDILKWISNQFGTKAALGTGFGPSGILLLNMISKNKMNIPFFYLDTDLLFGETYKLRDELETYFDLTFERVSTPLSLNEQAIKYQSELWKKNPNKCCYLRKVVPLKNYLIHKDAWITGIRRQQTDTRFDTKIIQWDPFNEVWKINPLANWTSDEVWTYIHINELPYNPLHDNGYPSIGCQPCTNQVASDDHERAGRWSGMDKTECGIHISTQKDQ